MFGRKLGRIVEISENLITVTAPPSESKMPGVVIVEVSNKYGVDIFTADKKLSFVYL